MTLPDEIIFWRQRYQYSPSYYFFEKNINQIISTNLKLFFIFLSLRETIKGWAIAAKKLTSTSQSQSKKTDDFSINNSEKVIFEDLNNLKNEIVLAERNLQKNEKNQLEVNLLYKYLRLCQITFSQFLETEKYFLFRVEMKKLF